MTIDQSQVAAYIAVASRPAADADRAAEHGKEDGLAEELRYGQHPPARPGGAFHRRWRCGADPAGDGCSIPGARPAVL